MTKLKLLIVEDNEDELDAYRSTLKVYEEKTNREIELIESKDLADAKNNLDRSLHGVIIDLKLAEGEFDGNEVIKAVYECVRIPIVILTGTPENADIGENFVWVEKKGEIGFDEIIDRFVNIYQIGITNIFGGRGLIEDAIDSVFWRTVLPLFEQWKEYSTLERNTESSILRITLNHIIDYLDPEGTDYFLEEIYLKPHNLEFPKTGSIVKKKIDDTDYIVISPACDLAVYDGKLKSEIIHICRIENRNFAAIKGVRGITIGNDGTPNPPKWNTGLIEKIQNNSHARHLHYLPKTDLYLGGFINFRKVAYTEYPDFVEQYSILDVRVSMTFTKDIVSRFSTYYGRQGQPDFLKDALVEDQEEATSTYDSGELEE